MNKIQIVVLAAGHGKRMNNGDLPKVLIPFYGKALVQHILDAIKESGICKKPVVLVGQKAEEVKKVLGPDYSYVFQGEQLGTGHAVACTRDLLEGSAQNIMILYGDHPFITSEMIKSLADIHLGSGKVLTMATVRVDDFADWRSSFYDFGRIIRDEQGHIFEIVEKKDATARQLEIKEVNPSYFCFKADWLWQNIDKIKNANAQAEYYLTDLAGMAVDQGQEIATLTINPKEALGVNTPEQLDLVKKLA